MPEGTRPVVMAGALRIEFSSKINQRRYAICVGLPRVVPQRNGCPVLYVLDGDWYFATALEAVRASAPEAAVVGIGYPTDEGYIESVLRRHEPLPAWTRDEVPFRVAVCLERMYDLSLPARDDVLAGDLLQDRWSMRAKDVGGLDSFLEVLEAEIKPRVAALVSSDVSSQAIFGHSLGGLAVIHALFVAPTTFRTFIGASPSLWWSEGAVLRDESRLAEAVRAGMASPRVLITAGSEEQTPDLRLAAKLGLNVGEYENHVRKHRVVDAARELTERLQSLVGRGELELADYAVFAQQDHNISAWPALGRAVSFAFPP